MRRLLPVIFVILMLISSVSVSAGDTEKIVGEVLYHQDFSDIGDLSMSGVTIGTLSSDASFVSCPGDSLEISTFDKGRVHVILPDPEAPAESEISAANTFTFEFSFRFKDVHSSNGYIAPILTCRGCDPANITSVKIRADGTVDDFSQPDPELAAAISAGETVNVRIPVISGSVDMILFEAGGKEYSVERKDLIVFSEGSKGFTVRNCDVEIDEVYIVNGTDYAEKTGYYADKSYANDESPAAAPECSGSTSDYAPPTNDNSVALIVIACAAAAGIVVLVILGRKKR